MVLFSYKRPSVRKPPRKKKKKSASHEQTQSNQPDSTDRPRGGLLFSGYKWYDWNKTPDIAYLQQRRELITALAGTIIPATDTPRAGEAGTGFYHHHDQGLHRPDAMNKFIDGLQRTGTLLP